MFHQSDFRVSINPTIIIYKIPKFEDYKNMLINLKKQQGTFTIVVKKYNFIFID